MQNNFIELLTEKSDKFWETSYEKNNINMLSFV